MEIEEQIKEEKEELFFDYQKAIEFLKKTHQECFNIINGAKNMRFLSSYRGSESKYNPKHVFWNNDKVYLSMRTFTLVGENIQRICKL